MPSRNCFRLGRILARQTRLAPPEIAGVASHPGPREENQDCAGTAVIAGRTVAAVADGLGGSPEGARAALSACFHAFKTARSALTRDLFNSCGDLLAVVMGFETARRRIAAEAGLRGYGPGRPGYSTTLIMLVVGDRSYAWGYLGDGAIVLRRADGRILELMRPQRRPGARSIVSGCLGPGAEGEPEFGVTPREPGDLLLLGTDGLFDLASPAGFAAEFHRRLDGSVQSGVDRALGTVAKAADKEGVICDDNMTLVAIRTPRRRP
jgi:serine/threonine protein phosphatase PrpC